MMKRFTAACLGLLAGLVTVPLAIIVWPFVVAWFLYNESEGYEK